MQRCNSSADSGVKTEDATVDVTSTVALPTLRDHPHALNLNLEAPENAAQFEQIRPQILRKSHFSYCVVCDFTLLDSLSTKTVIYCA